MGVGIIVNKRVLLNGLGKGLKTIAELAKVLVPTAVIVNVLKQSGALEQLAVFFAPLMAYLGLSGTAAVPLFSGFFVNIYAAIGSMVALSLPVREVIIIGVMLSFCHALVVELAISRKAGCTISHILPLRLGTALVAGWILGRMLK